MLRVRPDHPRCRNATWICTYGYASDISSLTKIRSGVLELTGTIIKDQPPQVGFNEVIFFQSNCHNWTVHILALHLCILNISYVSCI